MRTIPVDVTRITLMGSGKVAARASYAELADGSRRRVPGAQDKDEHGTPIWIVDVILLDDSADRAEVIGVKVASHDEPRTVFGQPVRFRGLTALGYVMQGTGRIQYSFTAEGIESGQETTNVVTKGHSESSAQAPAKAA